MGEDGRGNVLVVSWRWSEVAGLQGKSCKGWSPRGSQLEVGSMWWPDGDGGLEGVDW